MAEKKTIIVENILVKGYIKHPNGKKTLYEFNKNDFTPKAFEVIFNELDKKF